MPSRRSLLAALGCAAALAALASTTAPSEAAPRVHEPPPEWVAPGVRVSVRAVPDASGPLRLEWRAPDGWRVAARALARRGRVTALSFTPRSVDRQHLRLVGAAPDGRISPPGTPPARDTWTALDPLTVRPVSLAVVGDVSPGSAAGTVRANGPGWHWAMVGPWLRSRDLAVMNWENADAPAGPPWPDKAFNFLAPQGSIAAAARSGGIDAASLANNHALDFDRSALVRTARTMRANGITPFGGGANLNEALAPAILEAGGLRIAFVGFNAIPPFDFWASPGRAGNAPATPAIVRRAVRAARARADLVIPYFHWGIELDRRPNGAQRALAGAAYAAGADIVLGSHPHVLQPIERRGRRLTAWSLGNFLFSPGSVAGTYTGALQLELDARGVVAHRMTPVRIVNTRPVFTARPPR